MNEIATNQHIKLHNASQCEYFERTIKRTMIPARTPYVERQIREVLSVANLRQGDRVIEVGAGMGRYTIPLWEMGVQAEAQDLSQVLLDRLVAFDKGRHQIPCHCGDLHAPVADLREKYDLVLGFFTLHHLANLERAFSGMAQLLKPGGRILFLEPNAFNPLYYLQILLTPGMTWQGDGGIVHMRPGRVSRAMRRAGLEVLPLKRFGFFPPFLANTDIGGRVERMLERVPFFGPILPFQIFAGVKRWL